MGENPKKWRNALERKGMKVNRNETRCVCVNQRQASGTVSLEEVEDVDGFRDM